MQKTVALDIGGVCLSIRYDLCFDYFDCSSNQIVQDKLLQIAEQYERGLLSETEWLENFRQILGKNLNDKAILRGWNMVIGEDIPGMVKWLKEMIADGYRFIYFSDTSQTHLLEVFKKFSANNLICDGIYSFNVVAKKPESAMYEAFEAQHGKPDLYLDDRVGNIAGGTKLGWNSQLFTNVEDLRRKLGK